MADGESKAKAKRNSYANKRRAIKEPQNKIGDQDFVRQPKGDKLTLTFPPLLHHITSIKGTTI